MKFHDQGKYSSPVTFVNERAWHHSGNTRHRCINMKRPVIFIGLGMIVAFVMLAGMIIVASNALAGTRLREFGNGDIDVNVALSRPTATLPISGNQTRAGNAANDALRQRDLEYEEKLREVIRMSLTNAPAVMEPTETAISLPAKTEGPVVISKPLQLIETTPPATLPVIATEKPAEVKETIQPLANTPASIQPTAQPAQQVVPAPTSDDHGGDRNTPEPVIQPQPPAQQQPPPPPAPTDDHAGSNSGPSPDNTPRPPEQDEDSSSNSGKDKPPEPPKEPKP